MRPTVLIAAVVLATGTARAEDLVATGPGVMCRSAEALGRLTLPGGDSRTHAASPRPRDLQDAAAGGCVDIPPGTRVTVQRAFHNTSIVTVGANATPMVVPNADFGPAGAVAASMPASASDVAPGPSGTEASVPPGYVVVQRLVVAGPGSPVLEVLEDRRLTPKLRDLFWEKGGPDTQLDGRDPLLAEFRRHPLLNARLRLHAATGQVLAEQREDYIQARVQPAPIHGLPDPAILYTVDEAQGGGGFNGPFAVLLTPTTRALTPMVFVPDRDGASRPLGFMSTVHAEWAIVPARRGGPEEIDEAVCDRATQDGRLVLANYRFRDGQWHRAERSGGPCGDVEVMPPRSAFP